MRSAPCSPWVAPGLTTLWGSAALCPLVPQLQGCPQPSKPPVMHLELIGQIDRALMMGSTQEGLWAGGAAGSASTWCEAVLGAHSLPWQCLPWCFLMSFILISEMRDKVCNVFSLGIPQSAAAISRFHSSLYEHKMELQYYFTNLFMINNVSTGSCSPCAG